MPHRSSAVPLVSIRLYFLGPFVIEEEVSDSRGNPAKSTRIHLPTRKSESLLAYLVLNPEFHSREKLAAEFWGDSGDRQARDSLRNALAVLRKYLGDDLLITTHDSAQLNKGFSLWIDAVEFKKQIDSFPQNAIELYHNELLSGFYDDWIALEREEYKNLYIDALLRMAQQFRAQSEYARAIEFAQRILKDDATNERAHQILMFCYISTGDRIAALHQYEECKRLLRQELDVKPSPETAALHEWIKQTPSTYPALEARLTNLPIPLTSFIGRQQEIGEVKEILSNMRLLTLTGAGGSGKTRLAIQVANESLGSFKDGVWWVELAALTNETLVSQAVAKTLGVQGNAQQPLVESLVNYLRSKQLLLVLDNCEHLLTPCAQLATVLLSVCPHLKIVATSRESLGILGERSWQVPSMLLPKNQTLPVSELLIRFEGIRLFCERAIAVKADFTLTEQNASIVIEICQRLDGIPLAIEMAAARVQVLPVKEIAARLDERFNLLTLGDRIVLPRHQTLHALIDWSYELLPPDERILLKRLSVFAGGFTLDAAEKVCSYDELQQNQVLDLLSHLISKSLVMVEVKVGDARYRMLDTIREYAREKLLMSIETESVQNRHLEYYLILTENAEPRLHGSDQLAWFNRLESEHDNLRAALEWSMMGDRNAMGLKLAGALYSFWDNSGYWSEGYERLVGLLKNKMGEKSVSRGKALVAAGSLASACGYSTEMRSLFEEGMHIIRESKEEGKGLLGFALAQYAKAFVDRDPASALSLAEEGVQASREAGDILGLASCLWTVGMVTRRLSDFAKARSAQEESMTLFEKIGDKRMHALLLSNLAYTYYFEGDLHKAKECFDQSMKIAKEIGDKYSEANSIPGSSDIARRMGNYEEASILLQKGLIFHREIGEAHQGLIGDLFYFGLLELTRGNLVEANGYLIEGVAAAKKANLRFWLPFLFDSLGYLASAKSPGRAARLFGAAGVLREQLGTRLYPIERDEYKKYFTRARAQLDEKNWKAMWKEGNVMTMEQAIDYALQSE
jgi:non-specific serine/threonine protein kinase